MPTATMFRMRLPVAPRISPARTPSEKALTLSSTACTWGVGGFWFLVRLFLRGWRALVKLRVPHHHDDAPPPRRN